MVKSALNKNEKVFLGALLFIIFVEILFWIFARNTWLDEIDYLYRGWLIIEGGLLPWQDLWLKVTPYLYYIYGLPQQIFGGSFLVGRFEAAVFFTLSLWLLWCLCVRLTKSKKAGLLSLAIIVGSPLVVSDLVVAAPFAPVAVLILGSLGILFSNIKNTWRILGSSVLFAMAVVLRHNLVFAFLVFVVLVFLKEKEKSNRTILILSPIIIAVLMVGPYIVISGEPVLSALGLIRYPEGLSTVFELEQSGQGLLDRIITISRAMRAHYFLLTLFALSSILWLSQVIKKGLRAKFENDFATLTIFAIALTIIISHFALPGFAVNSIYISYSTLLMILFSTVVLTRFFGYILNVKTIGILALMGLVFSLAQVDFAGSNFKNPLGSTDLEQIGATAKFLRENSKSDDLVFKLGNPDVLLEAERLIANPALINTPFTLSTHTDTSLVASYHFMNADLIQQFLRESKYAIFPKDLELETSLGRFDKDQAIGSMIAREIKANYELIWSNQDLVFRRKK